VCTSYFFGSLGDRSFSGTVYNIVPYDMKNNLSLFERPFKIQKNGILLFEITFSSYLKFFCNANEISVDVILFASETTKQYKKYLINDTLHLWKY